MQLRIFTEPQEGNSYDHQLALARRAEECGFDAFFRSDHYLAQTDWSDGLPGPTDSWITLAGLARETRRIRLGTLVSSATFRDPAVLALTVAQVDLMSGGRVELGLGAGWFEAEHRAFGLDFPDTVTRFERLEEQLEMITGLWEVPVGERYTFTGQHYQVTDSPGLPKPAQHPHPPVIIGGKGKTRTPALTAEYAAEFNAPFTSVEETAALYDRVRAACTAIGRDPATLTLSMAHATIVGRTDAEVERRLTAYGKDAAHLREHALVGSPAQVADQLGRYAELGMTRAYLQIIDQTDRDHLDLIAAEVAPQLTT
ncbi:LLM class F420-dependent oxidoreductase [Actinoplanes palleronii]|uniref:LLM class F420-dependent oxidoreductase n=1 Tax=Actinoplanes palleronii TaxID=113570 RepID=A0ABQ4BIF1_9ACTN|nr:LLM class F420-dependent oxidoreductase [Actinoplanes palleronii]GIE70474.1 LLM class F420-dependent oxidoreductase [Actinoplanes palleronii]